MRIAIWLIFLIASTANAQDISGFMGIKFGTKCEDAKSAMLAKGGIFDRVNSDSTRMAFTNLKWAAYTTYAVVLVCDDSLGLCQGMVYLKPDESLLFGYYRDVLAMLKEKYGVPTESTRSFSDPYERGDGHELEAVQSGKASISDDWVITKDENPNDLVIAIDKDALIEVTYENTKLLEEGKRRYNKKHSGDY